MVENIVYRGVHSGLPLKRFSSGPVSIFSLNVKKSTVSQEYHNDKGSSLDNRPQHRKYVLIILVLIFCEGCRQNGD